jgi:pectate lyase
MNTRLCVRNLIVVFSILMGAVATLGAAQPPDGQLGSKFGADTPGGSGGAIVRVTNLNASGPGSLRAALETPGPRIVVFEVAGVIDLNRQSLHIREPRVTVAGQTAPSPGITLIRGGLGISTHDVIIRHLRVRPGDAGQPKRSGWEPDGITTSGGNAHDILIEHCSTTWATDENLSVSGPRLEGPRGTSHRVTIRHCLIAECLHDSTHAKGPHSMGSLIHDFCQEIAIVGNLYAHNHQRNPYFKAHTTGVIVNNVIYNPGRYAIQLGFAPGEWVGSKYLPRPPRLSIVGNVYLQGADTRAGLPMVERPGEVYLADNIALDRDGQSVAVAGAIVQQLDQKPVWPEGLQALPAADVLQHVIRHVGARPRDRDEIDQRIIRQLIAREGRIIDSQDQVGGYPQVAPVHRPLQIPETGVDQWLAELAAELE